ncbi:hypothetical protein ABK040_014918 [Willaertia magna]
MLTSSSNSDNNNQDRITINFDNEQVFEMPILHVPLEKEEGTNKLYCKSFDIEKNSQEEILEFFNDYGFVVLKDILTKEETELTVSDIFDILETGTNHKFNRKDKSTWNHWPDNALEHFGNVSIPSIFSKHFLMNRQNLKLLKAFQLIYQKEDLIVSHDRASFYRNPNLKTKFKTKLNVHLDLNPVEALDPIGEYSTNEYNRLTYKENHFITENNQVCLARDKLQVQGLINLADNLIEDGGFICVPGFHKYFKDFFEKSGLVNKLGRGRPSFSFNVRGDDMTAKIGKLAERIPSKAGSLIIWNQTLPHGSSPIDYTKSVCDFRSAFYVRMFPREMLEWKGANKRRKCRREKLKKKLWNYYIKNREAFPLSEIGRKVFDILDEEDENGQLVPFNTTPPFADRLEPINEEE